MGGKRLGRMPKRNAELVVERSKSVCEGCLGARGVEIHHRRFKSRGGRHNVANLAHLCSTCHKRAHGLIDGAGEGWEISQFDRRAESAVPFVDVHGVTWFFDDYGNKETDDFKELE